MKNEKNIIIEAEVSIAIRIDAETKEEGKAEILKRLKGLRVYDDDGKWEMLIDILKHD